MDYMALQDTFTANMRKYRKKAKLTQEKLAEICDTDPCYIGQIETGRRFPSLPYIERIAGALNIAPYLLFYNEEETKIGMDIIIEEKRRNLEKALIEKVSHGIHAVLERSKGCIEGPDSMT
jgi:transcriptional regulator with XRE-family HTH domain